MAIHRCEKRKNASKAPKREMKHHAANEAAESPATSKAKNPLIPLPLPPINLASFENGNSSPGISIATTRHVSHRVGEGRLLDNAKLASGFRSIGRRRPACPL